MKKVIVLPEFWNNNYIGACGWIRLLNPLSSDYIRKEYEIHYAYTVDVEKEMPDLLIIERLWHPKDINLLKQEEFLKKCRNLGIKIIYSIDDNLIDFPLYMKSEWYSSFHKSVLNLFFYYSDLIVVSTDTLKHRLSHFHKRVEVIPNAIDCSEIRIKPAKHDSIIKFGYLTSPDHTQDLFSILQPLRKVLKYYQKKVIFEINGLNDQINLRSLFKDLTVSFISPPNREYPQYKSWLKHECYWDFGIAPLIINDFTECKSDIKFLDYTLLGIPGIYSECTPFKTIGENNAGILAKQNWEDSLSEMIEDDGNKRSFYLDNALQYVNEFRNRNIQIGQWMNIFNSLSLNP